MKYPLAIFDFDGTLADSLPQLLSIFNRLAEEFRFNKIGEEDIKTLQTLDVRQVLKSLRIPFWKLPRIMHQLRQHMWNEADQIGLFPGINEFLNRLVNHRVRLAIVSSNSWKNIQQILGPHNAELFEFAECDASIFGKRPKLRKVIRNSGANPSRTIYIGDEVRDLLAASAEGLAFGAVAWGYTPVNLFMLHRPQEVFQTVSEMGDKLTQPAAGRAADSSPASDFL